MYYYFVSFVADSSSGNAEVIRREPITSYADIQKIENEMKPRVGTSAVAITSFILLRHEPDTD